MDVFILAWAMSVGPLLTQSDLLHSANQLARFITPLSANASSTEKVCHQVCRGMARQLQDIGMTDLFCGLSAADYSAAVYAIKKFDGFNLSGKAGWLDLYRVEMALLDALEQSALKQLDAGRLKLDPLKWIHSTRTELQQIWVERLRRLA